MTVFRVVATPDIAEPSFVDSFRSRAELGLPPRPRTPEAANALIHSGISVFETAAAAAETALAVRRVGRDIGGFVAELLLSDKLPLRYWAWGSPGHLTLWCYAISLSSTVVGTMPITEGASE